MALFIQSIVRNNVLFRMCVPWVQQLVMGKSLLELLNILMRLRKSHTVITTCVHFKEAFVPWENQA
jgi:hypothetical protein